MNKVKLLHWLHTVSVLAGIVTPFLVPAVQGALLHNPAAYSGSVAFYAWLGKFIPKS